MPNEIWRYLELEKTYTPKTLFAKCILFAELVIHPLNHIIFWICFFYFPNILTNLGYKEKTSYFKISFYIFTSIQVFIKMINGWSNIIEFYNLGTFFMTLDILFSKMKNPFKVQSLTKSHQLFKNYLLLHHLRNISTEHPFKGLN